MTPGRIPRRGTHVAIQIATDAAPILTIQNVHEVDDAGGVHYEAVMTGEFLVDAVDRGLIKLEKNIRPDHMPGRTMGTKTKRKIVRWAEELVRGNAVIGNISVRLDPTSAEYAVETDDDGQMNLILYNGHLNLAVDSESRLKSIIMASKSPAGTFNQKTRFQVRVWVADDNLAKRVGSDYNTRGDKVNDTAAKFAHQSTAIERMAKKLMTGSGHLGIDNVEVFTNTVSASRRSSWRSTPSCRPSPAAGRTSRWPRTTRTSRSRSSCRSGTPWSRCGPSSVACR